MSKRSQSQEYVGGESLDSQIDLGANGTFNGVDMKEIAVRDVLSRQLQYQINGMQKRSREISKRIDDAVEEVSTKPQICLSTLVTKITDLQITRAHLKDRIAYTKDFHQDTCKDAQQSLLKLKRQLKKEDKDMLQRKLMQKHLTLAGGWLD